MSNKLASFIEVRRDSHFPIQNLPYGIFSPAAGGAPRPGVRIGEWVLDLAVVAEAGLFTGPYLSQTEVFNRPTLNDFMGLGRLAWQEARETVQALLRADNPILQTDEPLRQQALHRISAVQMHLPAAVGDYTDFYSSREHASNVGSMFREKTNPLLPNWLYLPVAYHGRASSLIVSGQDIRRPHGQIKPAGSEHPLFAPTRNLDFELEVGYFIGPGNALGEPVKIEQAEDQIFGLVLVNDWSARDIQAWEYRPLGPFLAKNFATSISPWIVPLAALDPFRVPSTHQEPVPLPYLQHNQSCSYDIQLEVQFKSEELEQPFTLVRSNFRHLYWTMCQQVTHHTITGCNLRPGDLLATGTISGATPESYGSLLELSWRGERPIKLPNGEQRTFLEDGDQITMTGWCQGDGYRVGFGEVISRILPAVSL